MNLNNSLWLDTDLPLKQHTEVLKIFMKPLSPFQGISKRTYLYLGSAERSLLQYAIKSKGTKVD